MLFRSYDWADVRVDPNPDSLNIVSILQDAQTHHRWHPLGDGYTPQPGDWVLFENANNPGNAQVQAILRGLEGSPT